MPVLHRFQGRLAAQGCFQRVAAAIRAESVWPFLHTSNNVSNACYDKATGFTLVDEKLSAEIAEADKPQAPSKWTSSTSVSDLDDSSNVILMLESDTEIRGKYGDPGPMSMIIRCSENTTSIFFKFNGHFMSDYQYGRVTYRLDDNKTVEKRMQESTDHEALGLWRGESSIPFIKGLLGHEQMLGSVDI